MPKKKRQRKPGRRHGPPPGSRSPAPPTAAPPPIDDEPDLLADVRDRLSHAGPLGLLSLASVLLDAADPRNDDPFAAARDAPRERPDRDELLESFVEVDLPETTALVAALAELVDDELTRRRLRRAAAGRDHPLPGWLETLAPLTVTRAVELSHVLGDGDSVLIEARTGGGDVLTALAYIDHHLGTLVKDAFVVDAPVDEVTAQLREATDHDPDTTFADLALADARARVEDAIDAGAVTYPPLESETWPGCRPLVEWVLRAMPEGGTGFARPEWDEQSRAALADRFLASPWAGDLDGDDVALLDSLLWFACDYGPADPRRWSTTRVEMLLADWLPRKVIADADFLARAPRLLRGFVRFGHAEVGVREALTEETLAAIDAHEPDYLETIRQPRPQGPAALLAAMGLDVDEAPTYGERMRERLCEAVGGEAALEALDADPLPDEPFAWQRVAPDIATRVADVVALTDAACDALLDVECRTATRRLVADIAAADAAAIARGRADTAAAALVWAIAKANERLSHGGLTVTALTGWFGVSGSVTQRATTLLKAVGVRRDPTTSDLALGTPRYLTGDRRRAIIERRSGFGLTCPPASGSR